MKVIRGLKIIELNRQVNPHASGRELVTALTRHLDNRHGIDFSVRAKVKADMPTLPLEVLSVVILEDGVVLLEVG